jgi:hypothetical protein
LELSTKRRAILLRLPAGLIPARRIWPRSKGLESIAVSMDGKDHFGVVLKEHRFNDVFNALIEDLVRRVSVVATPADQVQAFLGQFVRWQKFLSASMDGLSDEAQRGLWGELWFLSENLLSALGPSAVSFWKGGDRAHQDFQFPDVAIEIKTTLAKQPQLVQIASERQLDDKAWKALFLHVIVLEVREGGTQTLPAIVASIRAELAFDATNREHFEDCLLAAGYLDRNAPKYADRGYFVRGNNNFVVRKGFPRICERDLPIGVGTLTYSLSISACSTFAVTTEKMLKALVDIKSFNRIVSRR